LPVAAVFFAAETANVSDCATWGRGLRSRNPICLNMRWHCLTPKVIP